MSTNVLEICSKQLSLLIICQMIAEIVLFPTVCMHNIRCIYVFDVWQVKSSQSGLWGDGLLIVEKLKRWRSTHNDFILESQPRTEWKELIENENKSFGRKLLRLPPGSRHRCNAAIQYIRLANYFYCICVGFVLYLHCICLLYLHHIFIGNET